MSALDVEVSGREAVADWMESTLVVRGSTPLGVDALMGLASEEIGCAAPQVNLALGVMKRRAQNLGGAYPFTIDQLAIRAKPSAAASPYVALLMLTSASVARQTVRATPTPFMAELFEVMTEHALSKLWGPGSMALRFGFPSEHGRPQEFALAVDWLARRMGVSVGSGYRPPYRKDGGVDVVAWRPFPDGRSGFPVVLVQCTLQRELFTKAADVDLRVWSSWLSFDFDPLTALAVPQTIPNGVVWDQLALRCMVLDRVRLAGLLQDELLSEPLHTWTAETVTALGSLMQGAEL